MHIQSSAPAKNWTLVGNYDAACNLEPDVLHEVACMQEVNPQDVNMVVQVRRKMQPAPRPAEPPPAPPKPKAWRKPLAGICGVAAAAGFVTAGAAWSNNILLSLGAGLTGCLAAGVGYSCLQTAKAPPPPSEAAEKTAPPRHHEPDWEGTRTYELTASPGRSMDHIDAPVVAETPNTQRLAPEKMGLELAELLRQYPSQHTAVLLGAHGNSYRSFGGYELSQVAKILETTSKDRGDKLDLVIFDSCLMGNLEGLRKLAPFARYAVASEEVLYTGNRDWGLVMNELQGAAGGPEQLGKALVRGLGGHWETRTLALIDLAKLDPLAASMEALGKSLLADAAEKEGITAALDVRTFGPSDTGPGDWGGLGDLGDVLERLQKACHDPAVQAAVAKASEALSEAVVSSRHQMCYDHAHGLSVHVPTANFFRSGYTEQTGMESWGEMLAAFRPPPRDRTIVSHHSII